MIITSTCFFHGPEEVDDPPVVCHECGHLYPTLMALRVDSDAAREKINAPVLLNIQDETVCPLCTHDL